MGEQIRNLPKQNYQKELDQLISEIKKSGERPRLLLHSCCGPCSSYCLSYLHESFDITVFYYNPNIDPKEEYEHRLSEQKRLIERLNQDLAVQIGFMEGSYDHAAYLDAVKGLEQEPEGGRRCRECFMLRLEETKRVALEGGYDFFGTTLTVSPHKNALVINEVGASLIDPESTRGGLGWLVSDFKKKNGYQTSIQLSHKYDLYRQNYCGCEFAR
ncbi:MAG: epoxyqueuosine reductase QueH [Lachnospiraceae bacterium]|nr:epoxyqueuosine reductase QueH [Lachnospiraceae bacterium]